MITSIILNNGIRIDPTLIRKSKEYSKQLTLENWMNHYKLDGNKIHSLLSEAYDIFEWVNDHHYDTFWVNFLTKLNRKEFSDTKMVEKFLIESIDTENKKREHLHEQMFSKLYFGHNETELGFK